MKNGSGGDAGRNGNDRPSPPVRKNAQGKYRQAGQQSEFDKVQSHGFSIAWRWPRRERPSRHASVWSRPAASSPERQTDFVNSDKFSVPNLLTLRWKPLDNAGVEASQHSGGNVARTVLNFLSDESGATAIEYGLIAAGISLAIIAIVNTLGGTLNTKFTDINTSLK
jgi:pilus assembly protein Flp/PilA